MSSARKKALETVINREVVKPSLISGKVSDYYASNVFNDKAMREHLSDDAYKAVKEAIKTGKKINREVSESVAQGMKAWAMGKGANSYTHWFQPLTGLTAEKHDMFFTPKGTALSRYSAAMRWYSRSQMLLPSPVAASALLLRRVVTPPGTQTLLPSSWRSATARHFAYLPYSYLTQVKHSTTRHHC
jgi:hypothetical protein